MAIDSKYLRSGGVIKEIAKLVTEDMLGNGALQNSGSSLGDLMLVGLNGWGRHGLSQPTNIDFRLTSGFYEFGSSTPGTLPFDGPGILLHIDRLNSARLQIASRQLVGTGVVNTLMVRVAGGTSSVVSYSPWFEIWHSGNATVDSNGQLIASSPVIKIYSEHMEDNGQVGEEVSLTKLGTGEYAVSGTDGVASDGKGTLVVPKDPNGNVEVHVSHEFIDGVLRIKTSSPDYSGGMCVAGDPMDVPEGRFISIRLHDKVHQETTETADADDIDVEQESMGD